MNSPTLLNLATWTIIAFVMGSLPLALWIGRLAEVDIRTVGDGNPGATNVFKAAGFGWGMAAIIAEFCKASIPVGITYMLFGWTSFEIIPIALAPSLGHAFSPFLNWRGGKALASMLGTWIGLTLWVMPTIMLTVLVFVYFVIKPRHDLMAVLPPVLCGLAYLTVYTQDPVLITVLMLQLSLVFWTHWDQVIAIIDPRRYL